MFNVKSIFSQCQNIWGRDSAWSSASPVICLPRSRSSEDFLKNGYDNIELSKKTLLKISRGGLIRSLGPSSYCFSRRDNSSSTLLLPKDRQQLGENQISAVKLLSKLIVPSTANLVRSVQGADCDNRGKRSGCSLPGIYISERRFGADVRPNIQPATLDDRLVSRFTYPTCRGIISRV